MLRDYPQIGEFSYIPAEGLATGVLAGTVRAMTAAGQLVDFKADRPGSSALRQRLATALAPARLSWLALEHGRRIVDLRPDTAPTAGSSDAVTIRADAALLQHSGLAVAFTTADCLPIVLSAGWPQAAAVLAVHAGWRGLAAGILEAAVQHLTAAAGLVANQCQAWIGPGIDQANYEIATDTQQQLLARPAVAAAAASSRCFTPSRPEHCLADLTALAVLILQDQGLPTDQIQTSGLSTFTDRTLHSARRDGDSSGRMANFVVLL